MSANLNPYPTELRTQIWPLCCGAKILSGFKYIMDKTDDQLNAEFDEAMKAIPYNQVYANEKINPEVTFLTLNIDQMRSKRVTDLVRKQGFKPVATINGRVTLWVRTGTYGRFELVNEEAA